MFGCHPPMTISRVTKGVSPLGSHGTVPEKISGQAMKVSSFHTALPVQSISKLAVILFRSKQSSQINWLSKIIKLNKLSPWLHRLSALHRDYNLIRHSYLMLSTHVDGLAIHHHDSDYSCSMQKSMSNFRQLYPDVRS